MENSMGAWAYRQSYTAEAVVRLGKEGADQIYRKMKPVGLCDHAEVVVGTQCPSCGAHMLDDC